MGYPDDLSNCVHFAENCGNYLICDDYAKLFTMVRTRGKLQSYGGGPAVKPYSANDNNPDDYNDIDLFNRLMQDTDANNDDALGVQDGWFSVTHNAEHNGCLQGHRTSTEDVRTGKVQE